MHPHTRLRGTLHGAAGMEAAKDRAHAHTSSTLPQLVQHKGHCWSLFEEEGKKEVEATTTAAKQREKVKTTNQKGQATTSGKKKKHGGTLQLAQQHWAKCAFDGHPKQLHQCMVCKLHPAVLQTGAQHFQIRKGQTHKSNKATKQQTRPNHCIF